MRRLMLALILAAGFGVAGALSAYMTAQPAMADACNNC
jgi:hypothetical protein